MEVDAPSSGNTLTGSQGSTPSSPPPSSTSPSRWSSPAPLNGENADEDEDEDDALACPKFAQPWFKAIFNVMNQQDLGNNYCRLLSVWCKIEEWHSFSINKGASLSIHRAPGRPAQLSTWIAGGCRAKKPLAIKNVRGFKREMWAWWTELQPDWRLRDNKGNTVLDNCVGGNWGVLKVHSQNGLTSAVACLCWWGLAVGDTAKDSWERCVANIAWVAEAVHKTLVFEAEQM
ncbi:hypothetical protein EV121DRAFT_218448 [Schizophyllum commune]